MVKVLTLDLKLAKNGGHFENQDGRHLPPLGDLHQNLSCYLGAIKDSQIGVML